MVLFEKQKGNITAIIEWTPNYYNIYHKLSDKGKKNLIYSENRKQKK